MQKIRLDYAEGLARKAAKSSQPASGRKRKRSVKTELEGGSIMMPEYYDAKNLRGYVDKEVK